jgi:hypothetical protein
VPDLIALLLECAATMPPRDCRAPPARERLAAVESRHRYFVVEQVVPSIAPAANAGQAVDEGLLDPGTPIDVVCFPA